MRVARGAFLVVAAISTLAFAAETPATKRPADPSYAIHPLVVVGDQSELSEKLKVAFEEQLKKITFRRVPPEKVAGHLETLVGGGCIDPESVEECLKVLAKQVQADRALRITIAPHAPLFRLTGVSIDASRTDVKRRSLDVPKGKDLVYSAASAMRQFLQTEMGLGEPDLELLPEEPPEPVVITRAEPWRRPAAITAASVGGAALIGAVVFRVLAQNQFDESEELGRNGEGFLDAPTNARVRGLQQGAYRDNAIAITSGIVAVAAGATSAFLFLTSRTEPAEPPKVSAWVIPGGGGISAHAQF